MSPLRPAIRDVRRHRGFSLIEMLIALAITATLLTSILAALQASFRAYQGTTEWASRSTVARLTMHRLLAMVRTGSEFGPYPADVLANPIIESDYIEFVSSAGELLRIEYRPLEEALYAIRDPGGSGQTEDILLTGVKPQYDENGDRLKPFTLLWEIGPRLYRASIDFMVAEDPNISLDLEGSDVQPFRLVASTVPRNNL